MSTRQFLRANISKLTFLAIGICLLLPSEVVGLNNAFNPESFITLFEYTRGGDRKELYGRGGRKYSFVVDKRSLIRVEFDKKIMLKNKIHGEIFVSAKMLSPAVGLLPVTNYVKEEGSQAFKQFSFSIPEEIENLESTNSLVSFEFKSFFKEAAIALGEEEGRHLTRDDVDQINRFYSQIDSKEPQILGWDEKKSEPDLSKVKTEQQRVNLLIAIFKTTDLPKLKESKQRLENNIRKYEIALDELLHSKKLLKLSIMSQEIERVRGELQGLHQRLEEELKGIKEIEFVLDESKKEAKALKESYNNFLNTLRQYEEKTKDICDLTGQVYQLVERFKEEDSKIELSRYSRYLELLPPAEIDLESANLKDGSLIQITIANKVPKRVRQGPQAAEIEPQSDKDEDFITLEKKFTLKIISYPFDWSVSPSVSFVKRLKDAEKTDSEMGLVASNYKPSPGVNLILRYNRKNEIFNFFFPSVIVNSSMLDFVEDNLEVGIGVGFGWLNDMIAFGWGLNLNTPEDYRRYHFITINFIQGIETFKPIFSP